MSSSESKRTRDQTSPTGNTPYAASKKSAREATSETGEDDQVLREDPRGDDQVRRSSARKALFQQWMKGEEKLLVMFVALHCLELDSAWPKYQISNPIWEGASTFLYVKSNGDFNRTGKRRIINVHEGSVRNRRTQTLINRIAYYVCFHYSTLLSFPDS